MTDEALHVAMLVGNAVEPDTRVRKTARTLVQAGYRVTLIGLSPGTRKTRETLDGVEVIHTPVPFRQRNRARKKTFKVQVGRSLDLNGPKARDTKENLEILNRIESGQAAIDRVFTEGPTTPLRAVAHSTLFRARRVMLEVTRARRRLGRPRPDGSWPLLPRIRHWWEVQPAASRPNVHFAEILDYEGAFGPVLDRLDADFVHAHDVYMIGLAARSVARRRDAGHKVGFYYDAHEFTPGLAKYTARRKAAMSRHEDDYIRYADVVTTVTDPIAQEMARRHRLPVVPTVVRNTPSIHARERDVRPTIRERLGLGHDAAIVVYSGNVGNQRGETTLIEALQYLPDNVHVALVTNATFDARVTYAQLAQFWGASSRLHLLDYVPSDDVVSFLSTATIGFSGLKTGVANYEMSLPNKMYDYIHAGLPLVVTPTAALKEFVTEHEIGEVYRDGDAEHLAQQILVVLGNLDHYRSKLKPGSHLLNAYCWEHDAASILAGYEQMRHTYGINPP